MDKSHKLVKQSAPNRKTTTIMSSTPSYDTDYMVKKSIFSMVNTLLLVVLGVLGWSLNHNVTSIERRIDSLMPRNETEIILREIRERQTLTETAIVDVKLRLAVVERDLRRGKPSPP